MERKIRHMNRELVYKFVYVTYILKQTIMNGWPSIHNRAPKQLYNVWEKLMG